MPNVACVSDEVWDQVHKACLHGIMCEGCTDVKNEDKGNGGDNGLVSVSGHVPDWALAPWFLRTIC